VAIFRLDGLDTGNGRFFQPFPANAKPEQMAICDQVKWLLKPIVSLGESHKI
jgi:hypothetical protein